MSTPALVLSIFLTSENNYITISQRRTIMKRIIEVRAAEGGEDSKLFVKDLAQAYIKFAQSKG